MLPFFLHVKSMKSVAPCHAPKKNSPCIMAQSTINHAEKISSCDPPFLSFVKHPLNCSCYPQNPSSSFTLFNTFQSIIQKKKNIIITVLLCSKSIIPLFNPYFNPLKKPSTVILQCLVFRVHPPGLSLRGAQIAHEVIPGLGRNWGASKNLIELCVFPQKWDVL